MSYCKLKYIYHPSIIASSICATIPHSPPRRSAVEYSDFEEAVGAFNPLFHAFSVELPAIRVGEYHKEKKEGRYRNKEYMPVCSSVAVFLHTLQKTSLKVILCDIYLLGKHRPSPSFAVYIVAAWHNWHIFVEMSSSGRLWEMFHLLNMLH